MPSRIYYGLCGWCSTNDHAGCVGTFQRKEMKWKRKRGKKELIVTPLDEYISCSCEKKHWKPDIREGTTRLTGKKRPVEDLEAL